MVRLKDGIVRNCPVAQVSAEEFKRNNDVFVSKLHFVTKGGVLHCCEMKQYETINEDSPVFVRMLPSPFNLFLLFGDILFVLLDTEKSIINFGQNDFRLVLNNQHPQLSPGTVLQENRRHIEVEEEEDGEEDDEDEEDEEDEETLDATTQEATTGTFLTHESSGDDDEDYEEEEIE